MNNWKVVFSETSTKQLDKLSADSRSSILKYLYERISNSDNPFAFGKALIGNKTGLWRYRVGKYRIICKMDKDKLLVLVLTIGLRDKIYS